MELGSSCTGDFAGDGPDRRDGRGFLGYLVIRRSPAQDSPDASGIGFVRREASRLGAGIGCISQRVRRARLACSESLRGCTRGLSTSGLTRPPTFTRRSAEVVPVRGSTGSATVMGVVAKGVPDARFTRIDRGQGVGGGCFSPGKAWIFLWASGRADARRCREASGQDGRPGKPRKGRGVRGLGGDVSGQGRKWPLGCVGRRWDGLVLGRGLAGATSGADFQVEAQLSTEPLDPGGRAVRKAGRDAAAEGGLLGLWGRLVDKLGPDAASLGRVARQLLVGDHGIKEPRRSGLAVLGEAAPGVIARVGDEMGAEGVGLDVPQDRQQVVVVLDDGALEAALPDVARGAVDAVIALGVGDEEALDEAADGNVEGADQEVDVVGHEAVAVALERPGAFQVAEGVEEGGVIAVGVEDGGAVVPPVDNMVDEAWSDGSQGPWHGPMISRRGRIRQE